jgi:hypothetical protein
MRKMTLEEFLQLVEDTEGVNVAEHYRMMIREAEEQYVREVELPDIQKKIEEAGDG